MPPPPPPLFLSSARLPEIVLFVTRRVPAPPSVPDREMPPPTYIDSLSLTVELLSTRVAYTTNAPPPLFSSCPPVTVTPSTVTSFDNANGNGEPLPPIENTPMAPPPSITGLPVP